MKIRENYPPNYRDMLTAFPHIQESKPIFCYGNTIYNPFKREITKDLEIHEQVHSKQQGQTPDAWYHRYIHDAQFRLEQELEAYGEQFKAVRPHIHGKLREWALNNMADALSGETYGSLLSVAEAKSKIRNYANVI